MQDHSGSGTKDWPPRVPTTATPSYYDLLDLPPASSVQDIRRAYREKTKLYHPDTTELPMAIAQEQFHQLKEAYATLSSPERRLIYDRQIGCAPLMETAPSLGMNRTRLWRRPSAFIDPRDRPLSPGELFALFILGLTFLSCLLLAVLVGFSRGELALKELSAPVLHPQSHLSSPLVLPTPRNPRQKTPARRETKPSSIKLTPSHESYVLTPRRHPSL